MHLVIEHVKYETELRLYLVYNSKCRQYRFAQGYYGIQSLAHVDQIETYYSTMFTMIYDNTAAMFNGKQWSRKYLFTL